MLKKREPRRGRKRDESITERKNKKIKAETDKRTVKDPYTGKCKKNYKQFL